jgi:hypothetical protein
MAALRVKKGKARAEEERAFGRTRRRRRQEASMMAEEGN